VSDTTVDTSSESGDVRGITAITIAVIAVLLATMAVDAFWLNNRIFDTDGFVESLAPLPQDPAVSTAIATRAVEVLSAGGTAESRVAEVLPDRLAFLTPNVFELVEEKVFDATVGLVESDAFSRVWTKGLVTVHSVIIGILDGDPAYPTSGDVGLNLEGTAGLVLEELDKRGIDLFAEIETSVGEIAFIQAEMLAGPRTLINVFHTGVWVLPIVALLVLAGLAAVPDEPRQAAQVDGASPWQVFRLITLPLLRPVIFIAIVWRTVDLFRIFDMVFSLTGGGPYNATETISLYAYKQGFASFNLGFASAVSYLIILSLVIILAIEYRLFGRRST